MRTILSTGMIAMAGYLVQIYFPWWSVAVIAFLFALVLPRAAWSAFLAGFLGVFLLWFLHALILDIKNDHILSEKMATTFGLPHYFFLLLLTGLIGGLAGGFSALAGYYLKRMIKPAKQTVPDQRYKVDIKKRSYMR